jgi:hypothetical protein
MTESRVPTRYPDGIVRQAGTPEGWFPALRARGRWVAYSSDAVLRGTPASVVRTTSPLEVEIDVALRCSRVRHEVEHRRRIDRQGRVGSDKRQDRFPLVRREGVDVYQGLDVGLPVAGLVMTAPP